jgi:preprotein translocase SecE subunit
MTAVTQYIRDAIQELELVRWPTRQQALRFSFITIGTIIMSAAIFGVIDFGFSQLVRFLLSVTL